MAYIGAMPLFAWLVVGAMPKVGDIVPDFTVTDTQGQTYVLSKALETGPVIVAFFPKAFTSG